MPLSMRQPSSRPVLVTACGLFILVLGLSACSATRSPDDGPRSDVYPDFSKPLTSAMPQLSDEDAARQSAQLTALANRRKAGTISEAEYLRRVKEMRALAAATAQQ